MNEFQALLNQATARRQAQSDAETKAAIEVVTRAPQRLEPEVLNLTRHMKRALTDCFKAGGAVYENELTGYGRDYNGANGNKVYIVASVATAVCYRGLMRFEHAIGDCELEPDAYRPPSLHLTPAGRGLAQLDKIPDWFYITEEGEAVYGEYGAVVADLKAYLVNMRQSIKQKSKAEIRQQCSVLLAKWKNQGDITDDQDIAFLTDLINGHIHAAQKIGVGIAAFFVAPATYNTYCFHIRRRDGSVTDFGISSCLDDARRLNLVSLRAVVESQIYDYRSKFPGPTFVSEFSGQMFSIKELHIDHVTPFLTIVDKFVKEESLNLSVLWTDSKDMSFEPVWLDKKIPKAFAKFHAKFRLRAVSRFENLSTIKRQANLAS
jgi:hypothetical protein